MKKIILGLATLVVLFSGCERKDADIVSYNLSQEADNFNIDRRIIFYNGMTGEYMMTIEGRCSLGNNDGPRELTVVCKTGEDTYKKHFLGLSDNVTYFVEQLEAKSVNAYHYKVVFKPQSIIPDVDFKGDTRALEKALTPDNKD